MLVVKVTFVSSEKVVLFIWTYLSTLTLPVSDANLEFGVGSGVVIGVPIPAEASCLGNEIERAIQQALSEAR